MSHRSKIFYALFVFTVMFASHLPAPGKNFGQVSRTQRRRIQDA